MNEGAKRVDGPIEGWKVFDEKLKCMGMQYKVGHTYKLGADPVMCSRGYHFSRRLLDCFRYKSRSPVFSRICKVRADGIILDGGDKLVANVLTVLEEVSWEDALKECNTGKGNTGFGNTGDYNAGDGNKGNRNYDNDNEGSNNHGHGNRGGDNIGHLNIGYGNIGSYNIGGHNVGSENIGHCNVGQGNIGWHNTGSQNVGHYNTGSCNMGLYNTGRYNKCDSSTGYFNSQYAPIRVFDVQTNLMASELKLPDFCSDVHFTCKFVAKGVTSTCPASEEEAARSNDDIMWLRWECAWKDAVRTAKGMADWPKELTRLMALPGFSFEKFERLTGVTRADLAGYMAVPSWPVVYRMPSPEFMMLVESWRDWAAKDTPNYVSYAGRKPARLPGSRSYLFNVWHLGALSGKNVLKLAAECPEPDKVLEAAAHDMVVGFVELRRASDKDGIPKPFPVLRGSKLHKQLRAACTSYLKHLMDESTRRSASNDLQDSE